MTKLESNVKLIAEVVANIFPVVLGADFVLYGPISKAPEAYQMCAIADAYVAYAMRQGYGIRQKEDHPISRVFRTVETGRDSDSRL